MAPSCVSRQSPIAARRRPKGSREPVGRWPSENETSSVSILSAAERTRPLSVDGSGPAGRVGKVLLGHGGAHRLRIAGQARVLGADSPLQLGELAHELGGLVGLGSRAASSVASPPPSRPASFCKRSTLSANVPPPSKNEIPPSRPASPSIPTFTSRSKLKAASSSRFSSTCVFPARTTSGSPPFATNAKRLPSSGK